MKVLKDKKVLLLIGILLLLRTSNAQYLKSLSYNDDSKTGHLCYSKLDKSHAVWCQTACVQKTLISRYKIDLEYDFDFFYRVGCESATFNKTLKEVLCDPNVQNRTEYAIEYMIKGSDKRSPRLFIRKKCCFDSLCNDPELNSRRNWYQKEQSMVTIIRTKFNSRHLLKPTVYFLLFSLIIYGSVSMIMSWFKSKHAAETGHKWKPLELELFLESAFVSSTIIDTKIEVTGRLNVKETAQLLSQLPDHDKVKYSRMKSLSSEESTKEMKTGKTLKVAESEAVIGGKNVRKVFIKPPLKANASGWGHNLWNTVRTISSPNDLLYRMIEHGPYQYPFTALELLTLFEETAFKMAEEPSLLQIDAEITVIGDIRGRYVDLHRWLQLTGWPPQNRILFLGGILDSDEPGSVECLALICSLKCRFPKHVFILRGGPETTSFRMSERIHPVITRAVQSCIKRMCSHMSFAAIIGKSILAVYSGFSPMIREKGHIHHLFRPVTAENMTAVERHIIFNQPSNLVGMYRPNPNAEGNWFGKQAVKRACKAMKCNVMIRGQSYTPYGYHPCWNNRLINLWSAPGCGSNFGAVLSISKDLGITPILMEKQEVEN